jgi:hypothetical protein
VVTPVEVPPYNAMNLDNHDELDNHNLEDEDFELDNDSIESPPQEAKKPPEEYADACNARLLRGVVRTNEDYGLDEVVRLPEACTVTLATFENLLLPALSFFASRSVVSAWGFSDIDHPICTH